MVSAADIDLKVAGSSLQKVLIFFSLKKKKIEKIKCLSSTCRVPVASLSRRTVAVSVHESVHVSVHESRRCVYLHHCHQPSTYDLLYIDLTLHWPLTLDP